MNKVRIIDEFTCYNRANHPMTISLTKTGNGNHQIRRNGKIDTRHTLRWQAEERFNKLRKLLIGY